MIQAEQLIALFVLALKEMWGYIWGTAGIVWTQAKQDQKVQYMVSKYGQNWKNSEAAKQDNYYSAAMYGAKWIGRTVADCSGLFAWAFKKLGGYIYHGSNTIWDKYCSSKGELKNGKRDDGKDLRPGTAIFTHKVTKKNGKVVKDVRGHIGLYIGNGWVIEASGTINGVIKSKLTISKWVEWGELKGVDYESSPADVITDPEEHMVYGTLRKGDKGPVVKYAQELLISKGFNLPKYGADGDFGSETLSAVKAFQKANGLTADGVIGSKTWAKLQEDKPAKLPVYSVVIHGLNEEQAKDIVSMYGGEIIEGA